MTAESDSDIGLARIPLATEFGWGWTVAFAIAVFFVLVFVVGLALPAWWGVGVWGVNIPVRVGLRSRQLRVVDRHRQRHQLPRSPAGHPPP
jgi:hypothetical protein